MNKIAKATDLNDWYDIKATTKLVKGKRIRGMAVITRKIRA